jgi:hypothetical protein
MPEKEIPRRDFIRYYLVGAGALILASCARRKELPQPQVTVEVTPTLEPTLEPTVTPTEVGAPEPIIGMPERLEEMQVIDYEDLGEFFPKLVEAEKAYLDKNGWPDQYFSNTGPVGIDETGYFSSIIPLIFGPHGANYLSSFVGVKMPNGETNILIGLPFFVKGSTPEANDANGHIFHTLIDYPSYERAVKAYKESLGETDNRAEGWSIEDLYNRIKAGNPNKSIAINMLVDMDEIKDGSGGDLFAKVADKIKLITKLYTITDPKILDGIDNDIFPSYSVFSLGL